MRRAAAWIAVLVASLLPIPGWASGGGGGGGGADKPAPPSIAIQKRVLKPAPTVLDPIGGFRVAITQVSYPGVPERSACRLLARAFNTGTEKVGLFLMVHTFDSHKVPLNSWLIPTAEVAPGQSIERIYSCKLAQYLKLDVANAGAWPAICKVGGEERSPCPVTLNFEANLELIEK
ncbi:conserved exported hypothetical protein [Magnetospirillum sp. LM-5]|uniref:hypothetical protein n=1 Tax=Magnetospirillum sp. LM-5 TaxID=2681466 RepID=UPI0013825435|nr:hypothetical protein [Magnetospirillum sp. LM-5]CAA7623900.1 conserved exported hypothetical protein [Magnetospirillum sp. LM-5]